MSTVTRMQNIIWMLVFVLGVMTGDQPNGTSLKVNGDVTGNVSSQSLLNNFATMDSWNSTVFGLGNNQSGPSLVATGEVTDNVSESLANMSATMDTLNSTANREDIEFHLRNVTSEETATQATTLPPPRLLTNEQSEQFKIVVSYLNPGIEVVGFIFCTSSVIVFSRKDMQSSSSTLLLALNLGELTTLVINIVRDILVTVLGTSRRHNLTYLVFTNYVHTYLAECITRSTLYYVFLLSLGRFLGVAFPFKFRQTRMFKHPAILAGMILVITLASHFTFLMKYEFYEETSQRTNATVANYRFTGFYLNNREWMDIWSFVCVTVFVCLPLISSFFLNMGTTVALQRHKQRRKDLLNTSTQLSENESKERQMTTTILTSSSLFMLLVLPFNVSLLVSRVYGDYGPEAREQYLYFTVMRICNMLAISTTWIDFICYMSLSSQFRKSFKKLFTNRKSSHFTNRPTSQRTAGTESSTVY